MHHIYANMLNYANYVTELETEATRKKLSNNPEHLDYERNFYIDW